MNPYRTPAGDIDCGEPEATCDECGSPLEWESCWACGGEGYFDGYDLMDEDPLWYGPDDTEECVECNGNGGYWVCTNLPHT